MLFSLALMLIEDADDHQFLSDMYSRYKDLMYRHAYRILRDRMDAEDVVNDCMLALMKKIFELREKEPYVLRAYIVSSIENKAIDLVRRKRRAGEQGIEDYDAFLDSTPSTTASPEDLVVLLTQMDGYRKALQKLPPSLYRVLIDKFILGLDGKEIAQRQGISMKNVYSSVYKARQRAYEILMEERRKEN